MSDSEKDNTPHPDATTNELPYAEMKDGTRRSVLHVFSLERVIIDLDGLAVLADAIGDGKYDTSKRQATPVELPTFNAIVMAHVENTTKVTRPDGSTETFENP